MVNLVFSIQELWGELLKVCPNAPSRSQFYEWLKASWCIKPQSRGGVKQPALFTEADLNRLIRFAQLKQLNGSLKASQKALLTEIQNNPELYGG